MKKTKIMTKLTDEDSELPDSKIPWWDNEYEGVYSNDPENGYPYDIGTKVQE
jgi:hypothetical protein